MDLWLQKECLQCFKEVKERIKNMTTGILTASYIISSVLFILALGGLSNQEKAKRAVWYGIVGMAIADRKSVG